jgi:hypothetical protein
VNVAVSVHGCAIAGAGKINASLDICTDAGFNVAADVPIDFVASTTQMNARIVDRAKAVLADQGITVTAQDTVRVFGGAA